MNKYDLQNPFYPTSQQLRSHPAVRNYVLISLSGLFLLVVCLAERGLEWWCLVPPLIGCLTLLTHWAHGPAVVLLTSAGLLGMHGPRSHEDYVRWPRFQTPTLMDLVLCISMLAYVVGHYRLLSLMRRIFPPDPRRPRAQSAARREQSEGKKRTSYSSLLTPHSSLQRSADLVTSREMSLLGLSLLVWTGLALMVWVWMTGERTPPDMQPDLWRILRLIWVGLALLAAGGVAAGYLRQTTATTEESILYLQDQYWRQTRREQSNLNRWLTWARLRGQRRKGAS